MKYAQGEILTQEGFISGHVCFDEQSGYIEIAKGTPAEKPVAKGYIVPSFVNAHLHIGDSFIRNKHLDLPRSVPELVAPPYGLKHRLLKHASEQEMLEGIQQSLKEMMVSGTSWFCDFREGGLLGVFQLKKALKNSAIHSIILSRPAHMIYVKEEIDALLESSQGIGLSSISDWEPTEIQKIAQHVHRKKKMFALHASEVVREDIDKILELKPDLLIHMIAASADDLQKVHEEEIPVVICPRIYSFFRLKNNFSVMKKTGIVLLLGTDNAMINTPDVGQELRFLQTQGVFPVQELLKQATYTPRKALNLDDCIQGPTLLKDFIVLERDSLKPVYIYRLRDEREKNDKN